MSVYGERRRKIYDWMAREGIALAMFEDAEDRRDPSIRWLSGQPSDALLFLSVDKKSLLIPWDINMAMIYADADTILPFTEFGRQAHKAAAGTVEKFKVPGGSKIEIPPATSYPSFLHFVETLPDYDVICRERGLHSEAGDLRAVKDEEEIKILRRAAGLTNKLIDLLEKNVRSGKIKTEADAAFLIDREARRQGCEGTGFTTIAAGPDRSFGIHAFPSYTGAGFGGPGFSILDFGLKYSGYTTDVTLTFVRDPSAAQEKQLGLVEKAYRLGLSMMEEGQSARKIAAAVDGFFGKSKKFMPHGLGHGIGLAEHEGPFIRNGEDNAWVLKSGMVVTLEPGLYDPVLGGCRLENDILITGSGCEMLTGARIIRL